ncbi:MAG: hypothetical protein M3R25_01555, partial [Bacteroidota bacterium]|nr:hypothetical protein [Bacteroidota bacterium]
ELADSFIVWSRPGIPAGYITRDRIHAFDPRTSEDFTIDAFIIPVPAVVPHDTPVQHLHTFMQQHRLPIVIVSKDQQYAGFAYWQKIASFAKNGK